MQAEIIYNTDSDVRVAAMGIAKSMKTAAEQRDAHTRKADKALRHDRLVEFEKHSLYALQWRDVIVMYAKALAKAAFIRELFTKPRAIYHATLQFTEVASGLGAALSSQNVAKACTAISELLTMMQKREEELNREIKEAMQNGTTKSPAHVRKPSELTEATVERDMETLKEQFVEDTMEHLRVRRRSSWRSARDKEGV